MIKDFLEWIKLPLKYNIAITFFLGFIVFAPQLFLDYMNLSQFREVYLAWLSVAFLMSLSLTIVHIGEWAIEIYNQRRQDKALIKSGKERLKKLSPAEKELLKYYIENNTRTQELSFSDGVVSELEHLHIIYRTSNLGKHGEYFDYNIQPWAWEHLNQNRNILD